MDASSGKLYTSEFESQWVAHTSGIIVEVE